MKGSLQKAATKRIAKAQDAWGKVNFKLLRNKAVTPKIKIMLWNSLIRSAMIYGLHTTEMPHIQTERMEAYMYRHIRTMMNPGCKEEKWYPEKMHYIQRYSSQQ